MAGCASSGSSGPGGSAASRSAQLTCNPSRPEDRIVRKLLKNKSLAERHGTVVAFALPTRMAGVRF